VEADRFTGFESQGFIVLDNAVSSEVVAYETTEDWTTILFVEVVKAVEPELLLPL
jgi:hypothetical protein